MSPQAPRMPTWKLAFMYGYWRSAEICISLGMALLATVACWAIYFWAASRGVIPHLSFEHDRAALLRAVLGSFAIASVFFFRHFARPDWVIQRRVRQVAATLGLDLTVRANGMVPDWVGARFTPETADDLVTFRTDGRCWALASAADPSRLLVLNHIPKVLGLSRIGGSGGQRELLSIMLIWHVGERTAELSTSQVEQLAAAGFKADHVPGGFFVNEIKGCTWKRGHRAIDRVGADRLVALWGICTGTRV